jgi:hypothetical protein
VKIFMRKRSVSASLIAGAFIGMAALPAHASSHREAPFIIEVPKVDATDFYMFRSFEPGKSNTTTLIANFIPFQDPFAGPNYYPFDENGLYEIHIDNNGDSKEDITFQVRFNTEYQNDKINVGGKDVSIPLIVNGSTAITDVNSTGLNRRETYEVTVVRGERRNGDTGNGNSNGNSNGRSARGKQVTNAQTGSATFDKPVDNIGNKSIPDYDSYADKHVYNINIPGCDAQGRIFVGQRKDPFVINVGETFDLVNIKTPATALDPNAERSAKDDLAGKNISSIAMEVPTQCLTNGTEPVIGGWITASLRQGRLLNPTPDKIDDDAAKEGGPWVQVSRLGMPLVNEVVIGLEDKNRFNHSEPRNDAQFLEYVTNPTLPALLETLFGSVGVKAPTNFPRNDLVAAFLTGIEGVNQPANVVPSEMLRLNTSVPAVGPEKQNRLGVLGGDSAGFPNGRRPGDDVVDIELRVAMGILCELNIGCQPADAPAANLGYTDGAFLDASFCDTSFPYLKSPIPGSPQEKRLALTRDQRN